jgi:hypothetical protein
MTNYGRTGGLRCWWYILGIVFQVATASWAYAGTPDADVLQVRVVDRGESGLTFHVTVAHPDTGWDDYCDGWDVVADGGEVLRRDPSDRFTRLLLHPHETEQPFTRSQGGIRVPPGVTRLTVRAHDIVDGFGGRSVEIDLNRDSGDGYTIERP